MAEKLNNTTHPVLRIAAATLIVAVLLAAVIVPIIKHSQSTSSKNNQLNVVAAENFWGNIASQLGGNHVRVTSIISDPEADPHLYESNANNAREIAAADVVITNGLSYDDFMDKLLQSSKNNQRRVLSAADILGASQDANPHLWYDLPHVPQIARKITDNFIAKDNAHKADYESNLTAFNNSLQPLLSQISAIKKQYAGQPIAYTERVPEYLTRAAGLTSKTPEGFVNLEEGSEPSPADNQAMENLLTNREIKALLYNGQVTSPLTDNLQKLAKTNNLPVVAVTETLPANQKTYQSWQKSQLDALQKALQTP